MTTEKLLLSFLIPQSRRKYTIRDLRIIAEKRGGKCRSKQYRGPKAKLYWECSEGHVWKAIANPIVNSGTWCPQCAGRRKISITEMHKMAEKHGGKCLSRKYINLKTHLKWQCAQGHQWSTSPTCLLHSETWCPHCAGVGRKTIKDMQTLAKKRRGKCLSEKYINMYTHLHWQCKKGHQWKARPFNIIYQNSWCHICSNYGKLTIEEMQEIAQSRNGYCLSKRYININTKLKWKCDKKHVWWARPDDIKHNKSWCPHCAKAAPFTIKRLKKMARLRGGICLSERYTVGEKLIFKCADGHEWKAHANPISMGSWCPLCKNYNQEKCRDILQKLLRRKFSKDRAVLGGLELDGYSRALMLGFEYNGAQHYDPDFYFHETQEKYLQLKNRDNIKRIRCRQKGIHLITIPYTKSKTTRSLIRFIVNELKKRNIPLKLNPDLLDISKITGNVSELKKLHRLVKKRKIECLSNEYINTNTKMLWRCKKDHEWLATPTGIKQGYNCPVCSGKKKHTIEFARELANNFNGKCLSLKYKNVNSVLKWECSEGHIWKSRFTNIFHGKHWCQQCKIDKQLKRIKIIATNKGGECVSSKYINNETKMTWKCHKGHEWKTSPQVIKDNGWCPQCNIDNYKLTQKNLLDTAIERGFKLLTFDYINNTSKLLWQCKIGHQWHASVNSIRNRKSGCPYCNRIHMSELMTVRNNLKYKNNLKR